jgi:hypothetical protein
VGLRKRLDLLHTVEGVEGFSEAMATRLAPLAVADPLMGGNLIQASERNCKLVFVNALVRDLSHEVQH